jgi:hypothetical protein
VLPASMHVVGKRRRGGAIFQRYVFRIASFYFHSTPKVENTRRSRGKGHFVSPNEINEYVC